MTSPYSWPQPGTWPPAGAFRGLVWPILGGWSEISCGPVEMDSEIPEPGSLADSHSPAGGGRPRHY